MADATDIAVATSPTSTTTPVRKSFARRMLAWSTRIVTILSAIILWGLGVFALDAAYYTAAGRFGCTVLFLGGLLAFSFGFHSLKKASEDQKIPFGKGISQVLLGAALLLIPMLVTFAHSSGDLPDYVYDNGLEGNSF